MNNITKDEKLGVLMVLFSLLAIVFSCGAADSNNEKSKEKLMEEIINSINRSQLEYTETVYLEWYVVLRGEFPPENDNDEYLIHTILKRPDGYISSLECALTKFPFKKIEEDDRIHFTIRFINKSSKEALRISLIRRYPGIIINGKAYEPTPEILKSLKYFMPYIAYEEISNSPEYQKYFVEEPQKEKTEATKKII